MYYVGLDVHHRSTSVEILDCNGKLFKRSTIKGGFSELARQVAAQTPAPFAVCYEASCGYGYLYEQFGKVAQQVKAAHPGQLHLIFRSKRKHNRIDASKLAKLLYLDEVPAVHVPDKDVRLWRSTIEFRQKVLGRRVMAKNQIRGMLRERGLVPPRGLWSGKGIAWLNALELEDAAALKRDLLVEELSELNKKIDRIEGQLKVMSDPHPGVTLLRTIPGIGPRTAEALAAYIDDPSRFGNIRRVGSYFGWDPCQDASADKNRLGHITRDGPATVRKLMCEAAWTAVRDSPTVKAYYQRVMRNDPDRKKIAIVAVAHYLTRVAASMLKTGEVWREKAAAAVEGGGENPSGPQGFSPPPATAPRQGERVNAPTPLRFPSSLCREGAD